MRTATEGLADDLARQRDFVREREPAYGRLLELLGSRVEALAPELERGWADREFFAWYDRPLLLLASLRSDALAEGPAHPLWSSIGEGANNADPDIAALDAALAPSRERFWTAVAERAVQTNETTRAVAWMWPAALVAQVDPRTPLHVVDVGTSAGLNLVADDPGMGKPWTDGDGSPLPLEPLPPIGTRLGLDLSPLDVRDIEDARWLRACVWPSDTARLERLDTAIAAYRRAVERHGAPTLEACPIEAVPERASGVEAGGRSFILQTIMRDYLSPEQQRGYDEGLRSLIESRPPGAVLWVELEANHRAADRERYVHLRAHLRGPRGGIETLYLAETHPHPARLFVDPKAVRAFLEALGTVDPTG